MAQASMAANPALKADAINVQEMKAEEITADLRPNPQFTASQDGTQIAPHNGVWTPIKGTFVASTISYLHERDHKRDDVKPRQRDLVDDLVDDFEDRVEDQGSHPAHVAFRVDAVAGDRVGPGSGSPGNRTPRR